MCGEGIGEERRRAVADRQLPIAAVLTCADSRVVPEHIFDVGIGELFVCRVAGNVVDPLVGGSLEYAVSEVGCRLLCVMGHSSCGAVAAAVAAQSRAQAAASTNLADVQYRLAPALYATGAHRGNETAWAEAAARENVVLGCRELGRSSRLIRQAITAGKVGIIGVWYDISSGTIEELISTGQETGGRAALP